MTVGVLKIVLFISEANSLKAKRQVLKKVIDKVKNKFSLSVSEVGSQDLWQKAEVAVSVVSGDEVLVSNLLESVCRYIEDLYVAEVVESDIELIHL